MQSFRFPKRLVAELQNATAPLGMRWVQGRCVSYGESMAYVPWLDMLHGLPLAVEFRHRSWVSDRVLHELECRRVALVIVDGPDLPALFPVMEAVTNPDFFYARFYGRNIRGWRSGKTSDQFDYNYSDAELCEWVAGRIELLGRCARSGILCFNNHVRAQAPKNAARMIRLLRERGLIVA